MSNGGDGFLSSQLSHRAHVLGLRLWEVIALAFAALTVLILFFLALRLQALRWSGKSRKQQLYPASTDAIGDSPIPVVSKEIKVVQVNEGTLSLSKHLAVPQAESAALYKLPTPSASRVSSWGRHSAVDILDDEKQVVTFTYGGGTEVELPSFRSIRHPKTVAAGADTEMQQSQINSIADGASDAPPTTKHSEPTAIAATEPEMDCPSTCSIVRTAYYDECQLYNEGCRSKKYSMEVLEKATGWFAEGNILGKGGYGVVYRGLLPDGSAVAVKHLMDVSRNQMAEFRVEVDAISCIRHKNLVGLLGYCAQGPNRLLIYEYVDNGNLDQWLHGPLGTSQPIPWNRRMNIVLGTAKGLAYLHEDLEPKVVHRDVKASNILLDRSWNAKISDFGLAKLLGDGKSHVTTRVMGTFGYVAPEYASTGLLTESSDVYSFGVLMMEVITGRDPVDYTKPAREMNVVEWTKRMVESKRWEDVADPRLPEKPSGRALKRALLVALRCVDPDALHRPRMGHVVYMLEADDLSFHHVCKNRRNADGHLTARSFRQVNGPDG